MSPRQRIWCGVVAVAAVCGRLAAAQTIDRRQIERAEEALRQEGQAIVALADAAATADARPPDFAVGWHHDFLKAQAGTFVPFVVTLAGAELRVPAVLLYLRLVPHATATPGVRRPVVVEEIYPVEIPEGTGPIRISRGFSAPPGLYDLTVVVRERERRGARGHRPQAGFLHQALRVPDYSRPELTTSTIILADRITTLGRPPDPATLADRPYVIGTREVQPRLEPVFRRSEELTVVFLVYHPALTQDEHFDLEVEYHFFQTGGHTADRKGSEGGPALPAAEAAERYVSRTRSQRFNPGVLGPQFEPAGQPVLAGQSVPLSGFEPGDYRLAITVTDLVAGRAIARQVAFSVRP